MLDLMVADKLFGHEYPVADVDVFRVRSVANSFNADANNTICINGWLLAMDRHDIHGKVCCAKRDTLVLLLLCIVMILA